MIGATATPAARHRGGCSVSLTRYLSFSALSQSAGGELTASTRNDAVWSAAALVIHPGQRPLAYGGYG